MYDATYFYKIYCWMYHALRRQVCQQERLPERIQMTLVDQGYITALGMITNTISDTGGVKLPNDRIGKIIWSAKQ